MVLKKKDSSPFCFIVIAFNHRKNRFISVWSLVLNIIVFSEVGRGGTKRIPSLLMFIFCLFKKITETDTKRQNVRFTAHVGKQDMP